ncbi:hypothetical protein C8J56DRAFT_1116980 [Mycena floridula]|nr:hypothetical protein C8J56DRAFT_1116980 [Mycena floridula]
MVGNVYRQSGISDVWRRMTIALVGIAFGLHRIRTATLIPKKALRLAVSATLRQLQIPFLLTQALRKPFCPSKSGAKSCRDFITPRTESSALPPSSDPLPFQDDASSVAEFFALRYGVFLLSVSSAPPSGDDDIGLSVAAPSFACIQGYCMDEDKKKPFLVMYSSYLRDRRLACRIRLYLPLKRWWLSMRPESADDSLNHILTVSCSRPTCRMARWSMEDEVDGTYAWMRGCPIIIDHEHHPALLALKTTQV